MRVAWLIVLALTAPAAARSVTGIVVGEARQPVAGVVVAFGVDAWAVTDAAGRFVLDVPEGAAGVVWARVPEGYRPGPVWAPERAGAPLELRLHRLAKPVRGPLTFVVAADPHLHPAQPFALDLGTVVDDALALEPAPAFFALLGDITQGNTDAEFDLVDAALAGLAVPYVPVPGNHDWYDGGATWFRRYGPDNYSFDLGGAHFVVWNMMRAPAEIERYLGAELARVAPGTPVIALTHAPPVPEVLAVLRRLGVDHVLSGHTHSNRVVDHGGLTELTVEPLLMGGLDLAPAGYRVVTLEGHALSAYHRSVVSTPRLAVVASACAGRELLASVELDAGIAEVTARIDCGPPIALRPAGGWLWRAALPSLSVGAHRVELTARSPAGRGARVVAPLAVCAAGSRAGGVGGAWAQLGGSAAHTGAAPQLVAPPLVAQWVAAVGGHALHGAPVVGRGLVYATATDLGDGRSGGVVALDQATGAVRWRATTALPVRGGPALAGDVVVVAQLDGSVLAYDARSGTPRWRHELAAGQPAEATSLFASPAVDGGDVLIGNQRALSALDAATGTALWTVDPVPDGAYSQSLAAVAVGGGVVVGAFHRELGGAIAWDRATGRELWRRPALAVNASPVIGAGVAYLVAGDTEVVAVDLDTGAERWRVVLHAEGFEWGNATVATPALAHGILVVPALYGDAVALDAATGAELWRHAARPGPLRTTHYRGANEAGFASAPVITGDLVWLADTSGQLSALELRRGVVVWRTSLGAPVLAALAVAGEALVVASFDGSIRLLAPGNPPPPARAVEACGVAAPRRRTGCSVGNDGGALVVVVVVVVARVGVGLASRRRRRRRALRA